METFRLKELVAAPFTPLLENGEINYDIIDSYTDYMVNTNFEGIFVNGSLAEGLSMTLDERKKLAEAWMKASKGRLQVIVHVGSNCIKDSQELSRHAESIGVTAIAALSPSYYKPESDEVLVDVIAQIASAASKTPFYYYDINFCTGLYIDIRKFMEKAMKRIPNLKGLKNSSRELPSAHNCSLLDNCQILLGTDDQYLSCLALGMPGVVSASYLGNLVCDMKKAFDIGDMKSARSLQETAQKIINIKSKYGGGINVAKSTFKILTGIDVGPVRLPLRELSNTEYTALKKDFDATNLADLCKPRK